MKRTFLLLLLTASLFSCKKDNNVPYVETITKGSKWGLEIGSTSADVYSQLQTLGKQKNFYQLGVAFRQPYSKPEQIQGLLNFYNAITLQNNTADIDRVILEFPKDNVTSISAGGALPDSISKWPPEVSDEIAIHQNDPVDKLYSKLLAIYKVSTYSVYTITLSDKPLDKPYDPDMTNYDQWAFSMSQDVKPGTTGTSSVTLFFKNGILNKIVNAYSEAVVYN